MFPSSLKGPDPSPTVFLGDLLGYPSREEPEALCSKPVGQCRQSLDSVACDLVPKANAVARRRSLSFIEKIRERSHDGSVPLARVYADFGRAMTRLTD
jgi:hypothetical protein